LTDVFLGHFGYIRSELTGEAIMKRLVIALGVVTIVLASGVAAATVLSAPSAQPTGQRKQARQPAVKASNESDGAGVSIHGGPIERFHQADGCSLVDLSKLQGNWTHGDYVAAVTGLGDASLIPIAAHSDCGKPMVSVGHRRGPPDFVLDKLKAHRTGGVKGPKETPGS
jgi:hypothetical protein